MNGFTLIKLLDIPLFKSYLYKIYIYKINYLNHFGIRVQSINYNVLNYCLCYKVFSRHQEKILISIYVIFNIIKIQNMHHCSNSLIQSLDYIMLSYSSINTTYTNI